jgi:hypothetical protein
MWLKPRLGFLMVCAFSVAWAVVARGGDPAPSNSDQDRIIQENSAGLPKEEPLSEVVKRFNQEDGERSAKWHWSPLQPPLTEREVVAALRWAIRTGEARGPKFLAKCRSVVSTMKLPKGSKLMMNSGTSSKASRPGDLTPPDISMWQIVLFFSIDQVPMQMSKEMVLIRLQFLDSTE